MNTFRLAATSGCADPGVFSLISSERRISRSGQPIRSPTKKVLRIEVLSLLSGLLAALSFSQSCRAHRTTHPGFCPKTDPGASGVARGQSLAGRTIGLNGHDLTLVVWPREQWLESCGRQGLAFGRVLNSVLLRSSWTPFLSILLTIHALSPSVQSQHRVEQKSSFSQPA